MSSVIYSSSNILKLLKGSKIFTTGGTGFLGSAFVEKILRTCPEVQQIYLLMRSKRGIDVNDRLENFLQKSIFDEIKKTQPDFYKKITLINGDVTLPKLGLNPNDLKILTENVNYVINCAANVQFNERLRVAANTNVLSTIELVAIAKKMKNLKSYLHVSTAFTYSHLNKINEEFYEPRILAEKFMNIIKNSNDAQLIKQTPKLLGKFSNTYVFTKAIAEDYLNRKGKGLPISILRPAIITGSCKEPSPGWTDTTSGAPGALALSSLGILRCYALNKKIFADLVPVDYVANCGIALLASVDATKNIYNLEKEIKIYNFVSSPDQPITWETYFSTCEKHYLTFPSVKAFWRIKFKLIDSLVYYHIYAFFFNKIPAMVFDAVLWTKGQKPFVLKKVKEWDKSALAAQPILLKKIEFTNNNVKEILSSLNETDKKLFEFDMRNFDWNSYLYNYVKGIRVYLLNDPMETAEKGRKKYKKLENIDMVLKQSFGLIFILFAGYSLSVFLK